MGQPRTVKLYCALPTWSSPSDIGLDLHDLHDLHSRSLTFIHDLTRALRAAKIQATYSITPFHSTFALIRAFPPGVECKCDTNAQCRETLQAQTNEQEKAYIAEWHGLPALIIT
ncbi:hypothetical protein BOTBODRAFT_38618 [Botryobasidium botryosum FD-172 SS1]|uniref:Uncharacterized protein n=1 Tax=Botryobasidium botryosum (strain FD-172 SS1) TaxID=930990 RepID=A0A067M777_BOTB1|nr:hypothetical protein BOTBODRAFT_38618 [Botryobasidium botryosum FD-172 SS1]